MNITKDKISTIFFKYSIPSVLGMLAISSAGIVDGLFVGNYIGTTGLAAINISLPIFALLLGLSFMLAVGGSVVSGKLLGEGDAKNASIMFSKTLIVIVVVSLFICSFLLLNLETILRLFGADDSLTNVAIEYLSVMLFFIPFLMVGIVLDYFVRVDSNPNLAFLALFLSALANVILDWFLIVYLDKGIFGAALATGVSQLALIIILLPHFFSKKSQLKFVKAKGNYRQVYKAVTNGASEFINELSVGITTLIFNYIMIKTLGIEGIAAFTIINYILWLGMMVNFGVSDSLQPLISTNYGAKKTQRIESFLQYAISSVGIVGFVMISLIVFAPNELATLFIGDSSDETKQIVLKFAALVWPVFLFNGLNLTASAYFTAIHKPLPSAAIALSRALILPVFFILTLPYFFDTSGVFLALPAAEFVTFVMAIVLFIKMSPKKILKY